MKKKNIMIGIVLVVVLVFSSICYMTYQDLEQEEILTKELNKVVSISFNNGSVDMSIKTKGDYAVVEKSVKETISEYISLYQESLGLIGSKQITNILTIENYEKDKPDFLESKKIIENTRKKLQTNLDKMLQYGNEEYFLGKLNTEELDEYYIEIYRDIMITDFVNNRFKKVNGDIKKTQELMNQLLDAEVNILNFLGENSEEWKIEDGSIVFERDELLQQYLVLTDAIPHSEE